jgi:hypothetical protein
MLYLSKWGWYLKIESALRGGAVSTLNVHELNKIILDDVSKLKIGLGVVRLYVDGNGTISPLNSAEVKQLPSNDNDWKVGLCGGGHEKTIEYGMNELNLGKQTEREFKPGLYLSRADDATKAGLWPLRPSTN